MSANLKLLLYRFFHIGFGNFILKLLSNFVTVKNLKNKSKQKNHPFLIAITVDTESGYVNKDERRIWQNENPEALVGYYYGIRNILQIFDRHDIKATFFLSTQCFSSKGNEYNKIISELKQVIKNGHEIGLHLHPDSDFALQEKLSKKFKYTSAFFYSYKEKFEIIKATRQLIKHHLGKDIEKNLISFRWGNWALDTEGAKVINKLNFKIDSSATPSIKGHIFDGMKYDWSKANQHYPWKLSITDYQATQHNNSGIVEIPIATFDFCWLKLRADPVNSLLLNKAFMEYYKKADRSEKPFPFVIITHSSEATTKDGKITKVLNDLDNFISFAMKFKDVEFVTLREAYQRLNNNFK